jgi:hypothetical protein
MPLDNRSRTKLKNPTISRTVNPTIKTHVTNTRINEDPTCDSHFPPALRSSPSFCGESLP